MTSTSSERHGLAVAWIYTSSPKGVHPTRRSAMPVQLCEHVAASSSRPLQLRASQPDAAPRPSSAGPCRCHCADPAGHACTTRIGAGPLLPSDLELALPSNVKNKQKNQEETRNKVLALHHLSTCARVKVNVRICNTKTCSMCQWT